MPRYEFRDEKSKKFWEIVQEGTSITTRWGRLGSEGQSKSKSFADVQTAQKEIVKQTAGKVKKGYELVVESAGASAAPSSGVSNPELVAGILQAPDEVDGYLVYGDWLQSEGEALGELVSIQHALANAPQDAALLASEEKLLQANLSYFFGPNQADPDEPDAVTKLKRVEIESWSVPSSWKRSSGWEFGYVTSFWENGFVHDLTFNTGYWGEEELLSKDAGSILATVLDLPAYQFVQRIAIGEIWMGDDYEGPDTTFALDAIVASPCASILREFVITGGDHDLSGVTLDASALWKACPTLERAELYAGDLTMGTIDAPLLRRFAAQTGGLAKEDMKAIAQATWPLLEDLEIWFGDEEYGGDCGIDDLMPLLQNTDLKLKRLAINNMSFGDEVCAAIVNSPLLASLESLELTKGIIGDDGAASLLAAKDRLSHIKKISVAGYFSDDIAEQLKGLNADCDVETRGPPDDEYRYVEVGE